MVDAKEVITMSKSEETQHLETDDKSQQLYLNAFQKHETLNITKNDECLVQIKRSSIEKVIKMMREKLKFGITYILFSLTSTETIETVETATIMKRIVKKYDTSSLKECIFPIELPPSKKLQKKVFNGNMFKKLNLFLSEEITKNGPLVQKKGLSGPLASGSDTITTTTTTNESKETKVVTQTAVTETVVTETVVTETVVTETVVTETIEEVVETKKQLKSKGPQKKTEKVEKGEQKNTNQQKKKEKVQQAPQSESGAVIKKDKEDQREDNEEVSKASKPTLSKGKPQSKPQDTQIKSQAQTQTQTQTQAQVQPQTYSQAQISQAYSFYQTNSNGLQLPHKYRSHPRIYGKDSRHCRVCNNTHGLIIKYKLFICRRCFRERHILLGWNQTK